MSNQVYRCYAEKRPGFDLEASHLLAELREQLGLTNLEGVRIIHRYAVAQIDAAVYESAKTTVCSGPRVVGF
ncbi:MAG: hypothetical protein LUF68_09360 [Clostridiales bacterium]|nr:hypothetical protein [Clostridiales bacterium]